MKNLQNLVGLCSAGSLALLTLCSNRFKALLSWALTAWKFLSYTASCASRVVLAVAYGLPQG